MIEPWWRRVATFDSCTAEDHRGAPSLRPIIVKMPPDAATAKSWDVATAHGVATSAASRGGDPWVRARGHGGASGFCPQRNCCLLFRAGGVGARAKRRGLIRPLCRAAISRRAARRAVPQAKTTSAEDAATGLKMRPGGAGQSTSSENNRLEDRSEGLASRRGSSGSQGVCLKTGRRARNGSLITIT